jgi:ribosome-associated toxin RatA of RatAB toxin-antitoxin module
MNGHRRQTLLAAPLPAVWELVGDIRRYPEWWPRIVDVRGNRFEQGAEYVQLTRGFPEATTMQVERMDDMHEVRVRCELTGTFLHWTLAEAQGETFAEIEIGIDSSDKALRWKLFDHTLARAYFRSWTDEALESLNGALLNPSV